MVTLYVNTDDQSSGEYATLALAEAALPSTLDDAYVIECVGATADTTPVNDTGITTTTTNTLTMRGEGSGVGGVLDETKYRLDVSSDDAINLKAGNDTIEDMQIRTTAGYRYAVEISNSGGSDGGDGVSIGVVRRCLVYATTNSNSRGIYTASYTTGARIYNNLLMGGASTSYGVYRSDGDVYVMNNMAYGWGTGFYTGGSRYRYAYNNISLGNSSADFSGSWTAASNNISSDTSAPGTNSLTSQVAADLMTDPDNGDYTLKTGSNAIGAGTDLSAYFTTDITGAIRSTWDIGAFAYISGGGDTELVLADALHSHLADSLTLSQIHNLSTTDATHGHTADQISLLQQHILALSEATHGHSADNLTLLQQALLAITDALHGHTADNLTLTQNHQLSVNESTHAQLADNLTLLIGTILLAIADATHGQTADALSLVQQHLLSVADSQHSQTADNLTLNLSLMLAIADALHGQGADSITLSQNHLLAADDALHAQLAGSLDLLQQHNITLADALHGHSADNITLFIHGLGLGIISDTTVLKLTPQRGKLTLTVERTVKHV